jgi:hypothetical protein
VVSRTQACGHDRECAGVQRAYKEHRDSERAVEFLFIELEVRHINYGAELRSDGLCGMLFRWCGITLLLPKVKGLDPDWIRRWRMQRRGGLRWKLRNSDRHCER